MYNINIAGFDYRYIIGPYSVGIITPSRKRHVVGLNEICNPLTVRPTNGSADDRVSAEEVTAYVLDRKLK
jgi:hypothetical protein